MWKNEKEREQRGRGTVVSAEGGILANKRNRICVLGECNESKAKQHVARTHGVK
jgi:hypothetical protein